MIFGIKETSIILQHIFGYCYKYFPSGLRLVLCSRVTYRKNTDKAKVCCSKIITINHMLNSGCQEWALAHAKQEADNRLQMSESWCVCVAENNWCPHTNTYRWSRAGRRDFSLFYLSVKAIARYVEVMSCGGPRITRKLWNNDSHIMCKTCLFTTEKCNYRTSQLSSINGVFIIVISVW